MNEREQHSWALLKDLGERMDQANDRRKQERYNRLLLIYAYVEGKLPVAWLEAVFDVVGSQSVHLRQDLLLEAAKLVSGKTVEDLRSLVGMPPREVQP